MRMSLGLTNNEKSLKVIKKNRNLLYRQYLGHSDEKWAVDREAFCGKVIPASDAIHKSVQQGRRGQSQYF